MFHRSSCKSARNAKLSVEVAVPIRSGRRDPVRPPSHPATGPANSMTAADGARKSPAAVADAPNPKPAAAGVWTNCGIRMKAPNMPKPTRNAVTFVVNTARSRIILMSTIGCRSEEHTSELQSHSDLVCRLLLEKKKKIECKSYIDKKKEKNKK